MSEALANLVRARLKNGKAELNEHDLFKLGLFDAHDTVACLSCSKKLEAAINKRYYVIRHLDGSYFKRLGQDQYVPTNQLLEASQFGEELIKGLEDPIKRQYYAQVFGAQSEVVEVRLSYVARKVREI